MKNKITFTYLISFLLTVPFALHAESFKTLALKIVQIFNAISSFLMVFALLVFVFGIMRFIGKADDPTSRKAGQEMMVWGTVGLFVMVAVWGLVGIIKRTFLGI